MVKTRKLEELVGYQRLSLADFSLSVTQGNSKQFS
jgi:hypothetical protein